MGKQQKFMIYVLLLILLVCLNSSKSKTPASPAQSGKEIQYNDWLASPHAMSMDTPEGRERMNKTGCAHCHTAQGYWEVILEGKESSAPYEDVTGLSCIACHHTENEPSKVGELRVKGIKHVCTGCHDLIVENDADNLSWCPQGSILRGEGGAEFEGKDYPTGVHSMLDKNCVTCHMAPKPVGRDEAMPGGHTFRAITKGETPRKLNRNGCVQCHDWISPEWVEMKQAEFKNLLETLADLLPKKSSSIDNAQSREPKFPKDPSLSKAEAMASFNYWMVVKDGTFGVHNPVYLKKLLEDSIESLKRMEKK